MSAAERLAAEARIAKVRQAVHNAIAQACRDEVDLTYEELVSAVFGVGYRFAEHLRNAQATPVPFPARDAPTPAAPPDPTWTGATVPADGPDGDGPDTLGSRS